MTSARVRIFTFGCKVNQCDSEEIARSLAARGYAIGGRGDPADIYIVNTCTVTSTADSKARKLIRRLARSQPEATLIATGCLAETDPYSLLDLPGVAAVVPNSRKLSLADFLPGLQPPLLASSYIPARTRAFVKLQDGCDHGCAYCIVPSARGRRVSKPLAAVLAEIQCLVDAGAREAVLCGIRLGAYGSDRGDATLAALLRKLREIDIPRLRLSSIEPMDLTDDLLAEVAHHPTLCHHIHLPLQSGDDTVLAAMGRGYSAADFASLVGRIREVWS
ncbi:MAG: radical SAM protein, partial [Armatimonadota bacterium]|nr:radical SAM protein [Armatimonadota bacterium]